MAETEEGLCMSAKERDRLKVLHEVRKRHITQRQAAAELGISVRWVRTLLKRLRVHGDGGLRHRLRGTVTAVTRRYRSKPPGTGSILSIMAMLRQLTSALYHSPLWTGGILSNGLL